MTPEQAVTAAKRDELKPVYLLLGEDTYLRDKVLSALKLAVVGTTPSGLNEDEFHAGESRVDSVLEAVRTMPMLARRRWVLVRDLERWEARGDAAPSKAGQESFERLLAYAEAPHESSVLVLTALKLDARRKLVTLSKQRGFVVSCDAPSKSALPQWVRQAVQARGRSITPSVAELIAEIVGPGLAGVADLIERLDLYVPPGEAITDEHVSALVSVVRPTTVWELVDAVGRRELGKVLSILARVYDPDDRGLRLLGVMVWSARQLLRFQAARARGLPPAEAAAAAGAAPFRVRAIEEQVRRLPPGTLEMWLVRLRDLDEALKGGSKRPPRAVLEEALIALCTS